MPSNAWGSERGAGSTSQQLVQPVLMAKSLAVNIIIFCPYKSGGFFANLFSNSNRAFFLLITIRQEVEVQQLGLGHGLLPVIAHLGGARIITQPEHVILDQGRADT